MSNVILRPFTYSDNEIYYNLATSSGDIAYYIPGIVKKDKWQNSNLVHQFANVNFDNEFAFVIEVEDNNCTHAIGAIFATLEQTVLSLNVSFFIAKPYRHKGFMREALTKFILYIKHETPFYSLYFDIDSSNINSYRLVSYLGGKYVGISPMSIFTPHKRLEIRTSSFSH